MGDLLLRGILLAQRSRLDDVFSEFRGRRERVDTQYVFAGLAVLAAVILGLWIASRLASGKERRRPYHSPGLLFYGLCRAHRLSWSDCWLLWRVAQFRGLADPAAVFLEPERLDAEGLSPGLATRAWQLRGLRARLFAGLDGEGPGGADAAPAENQALPQTPGAAVGPVFPTARSPGLELPPWTGEERI